MKSSGNSHPWNSDSCDHIQVMRELSSCSTSVTPSYNEQMVIFSHCHWLLNNLAQAFSQWIHYPGTVSICCTQHWALNWTLYKSRLLLDSPQFATSLFHHLTIGCYSFMLLQFELNRLLQKKKKKNTKKFSKLRYRTICMNTYKACSSAASTNTHMYTFIFDVQDLHLCLKAVVLLSFSSFQEIQQNMQMLLILNTSVDYVHKKKFHFQFYVWFFLIVLHVFVLYSKFYHSIFLMNPSN